MNYLDQDKKGGVHLEGTQLFYGFCPTCIGSNISYLI